jgi:hypothetical protein
MCTAVKKLDQISPEACHKHVERHFTSRLMAERYVEIYRRVLQEHTN